MQVPVPPHGVPALAQKVFTGGSYESYPPLIFLNSSLLKLLPEILNFFILTSLTVINIWVVVPEFYPAGPADGLLQ